MQRIGIFGGSFNPIHTGHISLARQLMEKAGLSEVWFVVSPQNPFKQDQKLLDDQLRYKMVEEALKDEPGLKPCDVEMKMPRPSYMADTLARLRSEHPDKEFVLVIGGDNWERFGRWSRYDEILRLHEVVVYPRTSSPILSQESTVDLSDARGVHILDLPLLDISSTQIREKIQTGESVKGLVPSSIEPLLATYYSGKEGGNSSSRIQWIDLAKGFCMLLVIWNHTRDCFLGRGLEPWSEWSYICFYFRMPLYFVLSGLFFKTYDRPQTFLIKKTNNLVIPYLTFFAIGALLLPRHISSIWFLACLFWCGVLFYILQKIARGQKWLLYTLTASIGLLGYHLHVSNHLTHWDTALTALPFYAVGYWLRNETTFLKDKPQFLRDSILALFCAVVLYLVEQRSGHGHIFYSQNTFKIHFLSLYAGGLLGTAAILLASRMIGKLPVISHIGRYSIIVLVFHALYLMLLPDALIRAMHDLMGWWAIPTLWMVMVGLSIPTIWVGRNYLPYILAQKPVLGGDYEEMKRGAQTVGRQTWKLLCYCGRGIVNLCKRMVQGTKNGILSFCRGTKNAIRSYIDHTLEDE